jgi:hypothetical protein
MKYLAITIFGLFLLTTTAHASDTNLYITCSNSPCIISCNHANCPQTFTGDLFTYISGSSTVMGGHEGYISNDFKWSLRLGTGAVQQCNTTNYYLGILGGVNVEASYNFSTNSTTTILNTTNSSLCNKFSQYGYTGTITGSVFVRDWPLTSYVVVRANNFSYNPVYIYADITNIDGYDTVQFDLTYGSTPISLSDQSISSSTGNSTVAIQENLPYNMRARLFNSQTLATTSYSSNSSFTLNSITVTTAQAGFGYSSSTAQTLTDQIQNQVCGYLDFYCYINKALVFLFIPSEHSLAQFSDLKTILQNKPPFGYFALLSTSLASITATATPMIATVLIPTTIQTNIFTPFKIGLQAIIWFVGLVWLYKRLTHIQL